MVKIRFLDACHDKRKCGAEVLLGSAGIGGLFSAFNTMETNDTNAAINARALAFQAEENQKNRDWQREENLTAFNREQRSLSDAASRNDMYWQRQFDVQSAEWYRQQDYALRQWYQQQEYNSPYNQVQRARQAGYNPSAVGSQGGGLQDTSVTMPHTSVPSPSVTPAQPGSGFANSPFLTGSPSQIPMQTMGLGSLFSGLGSMIRDISTADIDQSQKKDLLRKLHFEAEGQEINNKMNKIELALLGDTKAPRTQKAFADLRQSLALGRLIESQGDTEFQKAVSEQIKQLLMVSQKELNEQKAAELRAIVPHLPELYASKVETEKSAALAHRASASASYSAAKASDAISRLHNANADNQEFWNGLNSEQRDELSRQIVLHTEKLAEDNALTSVQSEVSAKMAELLGKESDYFAARFWNEMINAYIRTGTDAFGEFTKFKAFKQLGNIKQQQIQNDVRRLEIEEKKLNKTPPNKKHERFNADGDLIGFDWTQYY